MDPLVLSQELIRCPSITPKNEGALEVLEKHLSPLGFTCERLDFKGIRNLYARKGSGRPDLCLIGEPTSLDKVGDTLKIGRRGSLTGKLTCTGKQGHIAYPQNTDNPIPRMLACLRALYDHQFDSGTDLFEPTRFEVTSID